MPKDKEVMPEDLRFLPDKDAVCVFEPYDKSPLGILLGWVKSKPIKDDVYRDTFNSNVNYDVKKDLETIIEKANNGDVMAMYEAACFYYDALASEFDYDKASYWLFKVSNCDNKELNSHANAMLASMYYNGTIAREGQSYEKALYHRIKATENEEAQMQAAAMRRIGSGCEFNYDEIVSSFKNIKNGDSISKMEQALFYIDYGEFDNAIDILESISGIYPEAEYRLGLLYKLGVHTKPPMPDCYKAEHHFRKAIKKGHIMAAYEYGMMNFNPVGGYPKDFEEAEKHFLIAADGGIAEAQYKLGWIYRFGLSGKRNIEKAIKYSLMAAEQGHIGGMGSLACLYQLPGYINYSKAFEYAKKSADMGYATSAYRVANFYFIGRGCEPNVNKAYEYYKFAYEHGVYRAKIMMDKIEKGKV